MDQNRLDVSISILMSNNLLGYGGLIHGIYPTFVLEIYLSHLPSICLSCSLCFWKHTTELFGTFIMCEHWTRNTDFHPTFHKCMTEAISHRISVPLEIQIPRIYVHTLHDDP